MTGTAETEAAEFGKIYNLDVVVIPTNRNLIRIENPDVVYRTEREKFEAVVNGILQEDNTVAHGIRQFHERGQPVLVGTISIEKSETIADLLKKHGIPHQVLNAKQHERESRDGGAGGTQGCGDRGDQHGRARNGHSARWKSGIIDARTLPEEQAGDSVRGGPGSDWCRRHGWRSGAQPTVPMVLFQHEGKIFQVPQEQWKPVYDQFAEQCKAEHDEVVALGGLHILGTERHEARRIDNQLRGRAGRQGDPGSSRFFLSLEDDLMRIFGGERVKQLMFRLGMTEGVPIESKLISSRIENAQKSVEAQNFDARKHLLEYDDVMNKQRETIYAIRRSALEGKDQRDYVLGIAEDVAVELVERYCPREQHPGQWNTAPFLAEVHSQFGIDAKAAGADPATLNHDELSEATVGGSEEPLRGEGKAVQPGSAALAGAANHSGRRGHAVERPPAVAGPLEGRNWAAGYGQKDPLVEFKKEAFILFEDMMTRIDNETVRYLYHVQIQQGEAPPPEPREPRPEPPSVSHA